MSLKDATCQFRPLPQLPEGPPYPAASLEEWAGVPFDLPPGDPRLLDLHHGGESSSPPMDNLEGMVAAWEDHPEWLDFIDPSAPNYREKMLERDLYLTHWRRWLPKSGRMMDLGGGVGRFATHLLDEGFDVELVDPDLRSLWRAMQHCAGRPGRLDLHWTTGERLPDVAPLDGVIAAEVLCYVEDPKATLDGIAKLLKPEGLLFGSVEARWGWASSLDVAAGTLKALLENGVVHVPHDRWIQTYTEESLRELLDGWEILYLIPTHYIPSGPFEAAAGELSLMEIFDLEAQLRSRGQTTHQHRAWMFVARPPNGR